MEQRIKQFLEERRQEGLFRSLTKVDSASGSRISVGGREYINFSSNDYLGLASHPELISAARERLYPAIGSASSRLMTGSTSLHHTLEEKIAEFKHKPAALVFNSGYQANVGIISSLFGKEDVIFSDRLNHASIIDGIRLSGAKFFRFRHNDTAHLDELLRVQRKKFKGALIVTETVFSMDGDISPLAEIARLKQEYGCNLMVDEAHATGIFGNEGSGAVEAAGIGENVDIVMGTFSKALGGFGAYAALSGTIRDFLVNTCRSFIYSTSLPPLIIAANLAALDLVKKEPQRRRTLLENAAHLREKLSEKRFAPAGHSQIIPVIVGKNENAVRLSEFFKKNGYWITAVRPPTVPQGEARLRISLTYDHTKEVLDNFLLCLKSVI